MDLVSALVESIQESNQIGSNPQHIDNQERMQLVYEKDKLAQKMLKVKEFEDDLKKKINEFEEIFRAISEVQSDLHLSEKK